MKVGIYYNKNYLDANLSKIEYINSYFNKMHIYSRIVHNLCDLDNVDTVIVLGGDGTILTIAAECAKRNISIVGINYGHVGFLAEYEPDQIDEVLSMLSNEDFRVESRSMLQVNYKHKIYYALNDVVLQRSTAGNTFSNTVSFRAEIDGEVVDNLSSDGVIISTPTGSTAYSLSAGGSILSPSVNGFIFTPICPHSLHSRPIVISDKSKVKVTSISPNTKSNIIIDGRILDEIKTSDILTIKKSRRNVKFISNKRYNFYDRLLKKLSYWSK